MVYINIVKAEEKLRQIYLSFEMYSNGQDLNLKDKKKPFLRWTFEK